MKFASYKNFESFQEALLPAEQAIVGTVRDLIQGYFPELREKFAYGAPFYHRHSRVCFLYPASLPYSGIDVGVSFGLNRAPLLKSHAGLLEMGDRKEVGYIRLLDVSAIQERILVEILEEAIALDIELALQKKGRKA
jgi:Domain of unknown function (DU1801)